jgi:hypothetical protein
VRRDNIGWMRDLNSSKNDDNVLFMSGALVSGAVGILL